MRLGRGFCTSGAWCCTCRKPSARSGDYLHVQGAFCTVRPSPLDVQRALCTVKPALLDVQRTLCTSAPRWGANLYTYIGPMALKSSILTTWAAWRRNGSKWLPNRPFWLLGQLGPEMLKIHSAFAFIWQRFPQSNTHSE